MINKNNNNNLLSKLLHGFAAIQMCNPMAVEGENGDAYQPYVGG